MIDLYDRLIVKIAWKSLSNHFFKTNKWKTCPCIDLQNWFDGLAYKPF